MPDSNYDAFFKMIDQVNERMTSHGLKMDSSFEKLSKKIDDLKDERSDYNQDYTERLTKLESERNIWGKIIQPVIALAAGLFGGWLGRH